MPTKTPAIPDPKDVQNCLSALKELAQIREGLRGQKNNLGQYLDRFVKLRELGSLFTSNIDVVTALALAIKLADTDASNFLSLIWNENDTSNRNLNILVDGASRSLTMDEDIVSSQLLRWVNQTVTLSSDIATVTNPGRIILCAESGVADNLTRINGLEDGWPAVLKNDTGDTITVKNGTYLRLNRSDFPLLGNNKMFIIGEGGDVCSEISRSPNS